MDSAAVAAANDFRRGADNLRMYHAAEEIMMLHNLDMSIIDLKVYTCDSDGDGIRDGYLATEVPTFYARCPVTAVEDPDSTQSPRKLIWIEARQRAPLYFLGLLGFGPVQLSTSATAEAAPVDLVIVLDVSESMASETMGYVPDNFDPNGSGCNATNSCYPLRQAKDAANALIDTLYDGYDQVGVVTFDSAARVVPILNRAGHYVDLSDSLTDVKLAITNSVRLHDDPPYVRLWWQWRNTPGTVSGTGKNYRVFNPVNPEDRDGDGNDYDPALPTCAENGSHPYCCNLDADRWDQTKDPFGWGGLPCDDTTKFDAYDWTGPAGTPDGIWTIEDHDYAVQWRTDNDPDGVGVGIDASLSPLSTCTGCGMRAASEVLARSGRPGAVWVILILSDGVANLSDTPYTSGTIPSAYPNGFCWGNLIPENLAMSNKPQGFWPSVCIDTNLTPRYCIDEEEETCPPGTIWNGINPNVLYSVMDYARDMADQAALTKSTNFYEPKGNDIAVYAIGLGDVSLGEALLRYMAAVGDDGDRDTDPCLGVPARRDCGQYYYAPGGAALLPIFEDIASRIYTRITE